MKFEYNSIINKNLLKKIFVNVGNNRNYKIVGLIVKKYNNKNYEYILECINHEIGYDIINFNNGINRSYNIIFFDSDCNKYYIRYLIDDFDIFFKELINEV